MPCVCPQCASHAQTLGLDAPPASRAVLRKAFKATAKLWHPDRFEADPAKRLQAEEKFKMIQAASAALLEHFENPVELPMEPPAGDLFTQPARADDEPRIHFHGAHGCYTEEDFPPAALEIVWRHVHEPDRALAMVDLSRHGSPLGDLSQFILFTRQAIYVRDMHGILLLLWYDDLGEVRFVDRRRQGKLPLWHRFIERISGTEQKYSLQIYRRDGSLFYSIADQADDSVKGAIYNFLQQKRPAPH